MTNSGGETGPLDPSRVSEAKSAAEQTRPRSGTLRILAVSHLYPHEGEPRYGIFVARQLQALAAAGSEITLLVPVPVVPKWIRRLRGDSLESPSRRLLEFEGVRAIPLAYTALPGTWFWRWAGKSAYLAIRKQAIALHSNARFDVIYSTQIILGGDAGRRLSRDLLIPTASLAIGTDVNVIAKQSRSLKGHFARILRGLHGTLACGQSLADEIQITDPPQANETLCVYGVVDLDEFQPAEDKNLIRGPLDLPSNQLIVLYAGYLRREKGLFELLEAFETLHKQLPDAQLVVCGAGPDETAIRAAASDLESRAAIRFVGDIQPTQICRYMQASDLFVLPSYREGMPNVVMEAMACGLPVVCTSVGGLTAALSNSGGALLVPPKSAEALTIAMLDIVSDSERRKQTATAARKMAEEQFGVHRNAKRILAYLSKLVQRYAKTS